MSLFGKIATLTSPAPSQSIVATSPVSPSNTTGIVKIAGIGNAIYQGITGSQSDQDQVKAKVYDRVAGMIPGDERTQKAFKDIVTSGGDNTDAIVNAGLGTFDKIFGTNTRSIYDVFSNDPYGFIDPAKTEVPSIDTAPLALDSVINWARMRNDPLLSFDWRVSLPEDLVLGFSQVHAMRSVQLLNYYVEECSIGLAYLQSEPVFRRGSMMYYPGFSDVGTLSLTMYEDNRMTATSFMNYWRGKIRDQEGQYALPSSYKRSIIVTCRDAVGNAVGQFVALNAWPLQSAPLSLISGSSDRVTINVEFAIDGVVFIDKSAGVTDPMAQGNNPAMPQEASGTLTGLPFIDNYINKAQTFLNNTQNPILKGILDTAGVTSSGGGSIPSAIAKFRP